jgi:hypothetical protein
MDDKVILQRSTASVENQIDSPVNLGNLKFAEICDSLAPLAGAVPNEVIGSRVRGLKLLDSCRGLRSRETGAEHHHRLSPTREVYLVLSGVHCKLESAPASEILKTRTGLPLILLEPQRLARE